MKGMRKKRANGGSTEEPIRSGTRTFEDDLDRKNLRYTYQSNVNEAAEERKRGGRAKKSVKMNGDDAKHHAGRKPRKSGGRAGSDKSPFSSAHAGTPARGRKADNNNFG